MPWYGASVSFGSYLTHFFAFTLKNWQSEVQHTSFCWCSSPPSSSRGSSEFRDSEDRKEEALHRIEKRLNAREERGQQS
jgi:hypothetical protein